MNRNLLAKRVAVCAAGALIFSVVSSAGDLDPPTGPVGSTMKTLEQMEPRVPIGPATTPGNATALHVISQSGSYYLTGNVVGVVGKHGIHITASGVTLDLTGHEVVGPPGSGEIGILVDTALKGSVVRNGHVRDWGSSGIGSGSPGLVDGIVARNNGNAGLVLHHGSVAKNCVANENGFWGIAFNGSGTLAHCSASNNVSVGFSANVALVATNCFAFGNIDGFSPGEGSSLVNCASHGNSRFGFIVSGSSGLVGCAAYFNTEDGFRDAGLGASTYDGCTAQDNVGGGFALYEGNVLRGCTAAGNARGIEFMAVFPSDDSGVVRDCSVTKNLAEGILAGTDAVVIGCMASGNTADGIVVGSGSSVRGCTSEGNGQDGIVAGDGRAVRDCVSTGNGDDGISVGSRCVVVENTCIGNAYGIYVAPGLTDCRIDGNTVQNSVNSGFLLSGSDQLIVRNMARDNSPDYSINIGTNQVGPFETALGTIASTSPWANFSVGGAAVLDGGGQRMKGASARGVSVGDRAPSAGAVPD